MLWPPGGGVCCRFRVAGGRAHIILVSMSEMAFALFDTAIGRCAIVWSARGIAGVGFPVELLQK